MGLVILGPLAKRGLVSCLPLSQNVLNVLWLEHSVRSSLGRNKAWDSVFRPVLLREYLGQGEGCSHLHGLCCQKPNCRWGLFPDLPAPSHIFIWDSRLFGLWIENIWPVSYAANVGQVSQPVTAGQHCYLALWPSNNWQTAEKLCPSVRP